MIKQFFAKRPITDNEYLSWRSYVVDSEFYHRLSSANNRIHRPSGINGYGRLLNKYDGDPTDLTCDDE